MFPPVQCLYFEYLDGWFQEKYPHVPAMKLDCWYFKSGIHIAKLKSKVISANLNTEKVLFKCDEAGSEWCKVPFKPQKKTRESNSKHSYWLAWKQQFYWNWWAFLHEKRTKNGTKSFSQGKRCLHFTLLTIFSMRFVQHHSLLHSNDVSLVAPCTKRQHWAVDNRLNWL